ncbi:MAG: sialate O-acetylesterase [Akkermansiaceae bacterium]|nr:sialate O-acetylesterase [Akkermansiaceae bacterium]
MKKQSIKFILGIAAAFVTAIPSVGWADVVPSALFTDHMVIQRETQAPVWGTADAGEQVSVSGSWGESAATTTDASGKWMVKLKTPKAGGPHTLTLKGNNTVTIKDVLSGEVWFCSGQSNMEWRMEQLAKVSKKRTTPEHVPTANYVKKEMETASDKLLRQFAVPRAKSPMKPLTTLKGTWLDSSPQNNPGFSGTAYFFARELRRELDVPVGLINCAWGGTRIEPWMPAEAFQADKEMAAYYQTNQKQVATIFNGMVNPVIPYAIRGTIWYQGESNRDYNTLKYERHFSAMINAWRKLWAQGEFPFYFVQLTNYQGRDRASYDPSKMKPVEYDGWPSICDQQRRTLRVKNTGMSVSSDIGEAKDVHAHNKIDVGKRLALWALKHDYQQPVPVCSGPLYKSHKIDGKHVIIQFDHAGSGLMTGSKTGMEATQETQEPLTYFQICGVERQWQWAQAEITGKDTVTVSHPEVPNPTVVRYAWAMNAKAANLYNKEGLPASIFTTEAEIPAEANAIAPSKKQAASSNGKSPSKASLKKDDRIVFLGDSITELGAKKNGYVTLTSESIAKAYPDLGIEVIGAGRSGHKVPDCQKRLDRDVLEKKPTVVVIYIGINDVWHWTHPRMVKKGRKGTTPEKFESGLKEMIAKINAVGARVILCTPTVIGEKPDGSNPDDKRLDEYAEISRKVARETKSQLLDLRAACIGYLKQHNLENAEQGILTGDRVHMNEAGNRFLASHVLHALNVPVPASLKK